MQSGGLFETSRELPVRDDSVRWRRAQVAACLLFVAFCTVLYHWKSYSWFPVDAVEPGRWVAWASTKLGSAASDRTTVLHTLLRSASGPSFYYTLLYSSLVVVFGIHLMVILILTSCVNLWLGVRVNLVLKSILTRAQLL